jgi:hypothetical protein
VKWSAPTQQLDELLSFGCVNAVFLAMLFHVQLARAWFFDLSVLHILHWTFLLMKKRCRVAHGS